MVVKRAYGWRIHIMHIAGIMGIHMGMVGIELFLRMFFCVFIFCEPPVAAFLLCPGLPKIEIIFKQTNYPIELVGEWLKT